MTHGLPGQYKRNKLYRYAQSDGSTFLLLLLSLSFRALFAVVCILFCALLLSNVSFGIHDCSNAPCGIVDRFSMDVLLFWVCRRSRNRAGWVLFFLLVGLRFSDF